MVDFACIIDLSFCQNNSVLRGILRPYTNCRFGGSAKGGFYMNSTRGLDITALTLVIIGAINWGLIGFFRLDLLSEIFGGQTAMVSRIIYALVGLAGLYTFTVYGKLRDSHENY